MVACRGVGTEWDRESLFALGLHVKGFFDKVFNLENCFLMSPQSVAIMREVRKLAVESGLPAYSTRTHEGFWRFLVIREAKRTGQILVHLITSGTPGESQSVDQLSRDKQPEFPGNIIQ